MTDLSTLHLWDRLVLAKRHLEPVQSQYRVVFRDPWIVDGPVRVLVPDPNWMAAAMKGGILPPVECYHQMVLSLGVQFPNEKQAWFKFRGADVGDAMDDALRRGAEYLGQHVVFHELHIAPPLGPMTEEQALEYQAKAWLPKRVRNYRGNSPAWKFVRTNRIPTDRTYRNLWSMSDVA